MDNLQIFQSPEFGRVRMVMVDGKPHAVGVDVARALEYAKPSQAVIDHCKGIRKLGIPSAGGEQETNVIPKGDVFRLIAKAADQSKNPDIKEKAERFERWIFDEVLPVIHETGLYAPAPQSQEDYLVTQARLLVQQAEAMRDLRTRVDQQDQRIETIKETLIAVDEDWRREINTNLNRIGYKLGGGEKYRNIKNQSYDILEERAACDLGRRLENLKGRLKAQGATQTKINNVCYLDIIEADQRLKAIYTTIVKELAIRFLV